jgi:hypothetical protein
MSVQVHPQEIFTFPLWIVSSHYEYGFLVLIQIPDSYMLSVTVPEDPTPQNSIVGNGGKN